VSEKNFCKTSLLWALVVQNHGQPSGVQYAMPLPQPHPQWNRHRHRSRIR